MEIVRCKTKEEASAKAVAGLNYLFREIKGPILFLSSGGSSLGLLDGLELGDRITVSVLDERYNADPRINNFSQLMNHVNPTKFIDTRMQEGETLEGLAVRFEKALRSWKNQNPSGTIIITQGMGSDGHTAGIMPDSMVDDPAQWVIGYNAKEKNEYPLRVTCTFSFLRTVDHSIAYITGQKKKEAFNRVLAEEGTLEEMPARIMREMGNVKIFTDIV